MSNQEQLLEMAQCLGRIEGKLDALSGPEGRITKLEKSQERQWWYSVVIAPAFTLAHIAARKLGINV